VTKFNIDKLVNPGLKEHKEEETDWELIKMKKNFVTKPDKAPTFATAVV
jgi:hypothetical protein